ncbi:preprotein translocase subunit SecG [Novosphingobium sp. TH158]|uniref:preprotein translocase subunit SecG n=1 Tax=Novosphingobium sp. TH158 TaxID=2067455 RepID=UPI000C7976E1|nr:preprotein translocase subunit SecG [Novosphingobium sp. TH158]PLK25831.1 preprotein translocase subunit SecG [Novosphingobium sp. TH158]
MFLFITVVQAIVGALLVGVILMQKSEGGGLGVGGSPTGLMSARGAADFLSRATKILAIIFVGLSILLAALAAGHGSGQKIDTSLNRATPAPVQVPAAPNPGAPGINPAAPAAGPAAPAANPNPAAPATK